MDEFLYSNMTYLSEEDHTWDNLYY
jgi:hypothetical protein